MNKDIFISFVEEVVLNPDYYGYIGGRIEVTHPGDHLPSEEIRFFTKNINDFYIFRDRWDWKDITKKQLNQIREVVKVFFNEV